MYKQCGLGRRTSTGGSIRTVSWLPVKYAVKDRVLKLKGGDGEWVDGWVVIWVSSQERETAPDYRKAIRGHRSNTGDSMRKQSNG